MKLNTNKNRRFFLRKVGIITAGSFIVSKRKDSNAQSSQKPNIILILADDVSAKEFTCYGGTGIQTPVIDDMAQNGIMFKTAWATPVCGPTRAQLQTGRYPFRQKFFDNAVLPNHKMWDKNTMMANAMKEAGYTTAMYGKIHHDGDPVKDYGFDEYCLARYWDGYDGPWQERGSKTQGMYAIQWYWHPGLVANGEGIPTTANDFGPDIEVDRLNDFVKRHKDVPFFVYYPTNMPHMQYSQAQTWSYTEVPERDASDNWTGGKIKGSLKTNLEYIDILLKRMINNLTDLGIRERTIIIICGDNGTAGYGKNQLESEIGPRVPFIVNCPGLVPATGPCDELVDFSDIFPTLLEIAGGQLPEDYVIDGHSFAPLAINKEFTPRDWIFCQFRDSRWLRDKRWLLDGSGKFWDCGDNRDETKGYIDVTHSLDPEVLSARLRFERVLTNLPLPDYDDPATKDRWRSYFTTNEPVTLENPDYLFSSFQLYQNYPNPFNSSTSISYHLLEPAFVQIAVYDTVGRRVETLINRRKDIGFHTTTWNANKISSGTYIIRMEADGYVSEKKCIFLK